MDMESGADSALKEPNAEERIDIATLRVNEERFKSMLALGSEWYWEQDENHRFTHIVGASLERAGIDPQKHLGSGLWQDGARQGAEGNGWTTLRTIIKENLPFSDILLQRVNERGELRYISASGQPVFDSERRFKGYRGIARDVTSSTHARQLLRLEHLVASCLAGAGDPSATLKAVMRAVCETQQWQCGRYFRVDQEAGVLRFAESWCMPDATVERFISGSRGVVFAPGVGLTGRVWESGSALWVADLSEDARVHSRDLHRNANTRGAFVFPVSVEGRTVGVLGFNSRDVREPDERLLQAVRVIGSQIGQFLQRKQAEEQLRIAAIAFDSQAAMVVTDHSGVIVRVNRAFTQISGYRAEDAIGQTPRMLSSGRHDKAFYEQMWRTLAASGYWQGEIWNRHRDGKCYAAWLTISSVATVDGAVTHYVGTFSDITQKKEADAKIHRLAYFDPLTQLPNRRMLQDRIGHALESCLRDGQHGALLFLDLDHFKNLNDTRGHESGDRLLVDTAGRLLANVRTVDTVARIGGDEFVVMLEGLSVERQQAAIQADDVGEKILEILARPYDVGGHAFHCTVSIGVALFSGATETVETLLKNADLAMYKAKSAGRNTLRFFDPGMQTALDERSAMEADLRCAVEREQLFLYYQAQVSGAGRIVGAEALLRWAHPTRGLVPPGDFIPLAEETGLILPIGQWVLERACAQIKAWSSLPEACELQVAVNVSARQFRQPDFVAEVKRVLAASGANPSRLKIELTESMILNDLDDTLAKMYALPSLGIGFSLDDFGTGYSSLSYLTKLPLEQLKIDKSFVRNLPDGRNDAIIAQTIITMGRSLGMVVIAEGVETRAQLAFLDGQGCSAYQGFLFSRPLPLKEFEKRLAAEFAQEAMSLAR
jgi:diguanylate cyclase (GGDEF)-like protein/PAS domain S-box-containing protein